MMVKLLRSFTVCQVVKLRDVGFSKSKIPDQLSSKSRFSAHYAGKRYLENKFRGPTIEWKTPKLSKKSEKSVLPMF